MKGLILKDIYALRKQGKVLLLLLVFYLFYSIMTKNVSMLSAMVAMISAITPITTLSYDEMCKWDRYALSMPVSRKMIVLSKYIFGILLVLLGMIIVAPISAGIVTYTGEMGIKTALLILLAISGIGIVFFSFIMPLLFKFGVEKGRMLMFLIFFIPMAGVYVIKTLKLQIPNVQTLKLLAALSPLFVLVILAVSVLISIRIYVKKEF